MRLAFDGLTALQILRAVRGGHAGEEASRILALSSALPAPWSDAANDGSHHIAVLTTRLPVEPSPGKERRRWTPSLLQLLRVGSWSIPRQRKLHVAVPSRDSRLQVKDVSCSVRNAGLPEGSFISLPDGIQIPCPELLFVEMMQVMDPFALQLLGCELCGRYARDPLNPRDGDCRFGVAPVTSIARIKSYMDACRRVPRRRELVALLDCVFDEVWSPMEAVIAVIAARPLQELGYGLAPVVLNRRVDVPEASSALSRVPDMLLKDSNVGLNYEGEGHLDLRSIAEAGIRVSDDPGTRNTSSELERVTLSVREKYVDDRRRDRELSAAGYTVFAVTKEDLSEQGGLDRVMSLVCEALIREGAIDENARVQRGRYVAGSLPRLRQDLVWSVLPGQSGRKAARRVQEHGKVRERGVQSLSICWDVL